MMNEKDKKDALRLSYLLGYVSLPGLVSFFVLFFSL